MDKKMKKDLKDILFIGIFELVVIIIIMLNDDIYLKIGQRSVNLIFMCITFGLVISIRVSIILYSARKSESKQEK